MNRLLAANFARVKKNKLFWVLCGISAFIALIMVLSALASRDTRIDGQICNEVLDIQLAVAVFVSIFFGTEYGDGTIRNKLIVGHARWQIYLANLITSVVCTLGFVASFMAPILLIGLPCFEMPSALTIKILAVSVVTLIAFCVLFTMISMIYSNKAGATVINLVLVFVLSIIGVVTHEYLISPEFFPVYGIDEGSLEYVANPNYVTGAARVILRILTDLSPAGQAVQFSLGLTSPLWSLPLYSVGFSAACTAVGIAVFNKKDIK